MSELKTGYTTGTCASAASKAASIVLTGGETPASVDVALPDGERVAIQILYARLTESGAEATVIKDAGDDPDITHGATIVAHVSWSDGQGIGFAAGEGVGTVTKPGLSIPPGEPAINPVPRRMIEASVREITDRGVTVTISVSGGRELAEKTFNPRLGIVGGISILGTSGRVRPFSCAALRTALRCTLDVAIGCGIRNPVFVPGHIGERSARRHFRLVDQQVIEVSNEWGFMLEAAADCPFDSLLVMGHPGKLAKLAMGEWDTHSSKSDSAAPYTIGVAARVLERELPESNTVEGVFAALTIDEQQRLGAAIAGEVCKSVHEYIGSRFAISSALVNMREELLGTSGDLTPWQ